MKHNNVQALLLARSTLTDAQINAIRTGDTQASNLIGSALTELDEALHVANVGAVSILDTLFEQLSATRQARLYNRD